jgi:DNA-binding response OmpR family regulator
LAKIDCGEIAMQTAHTVLVIEDDPSLAEVLQLALELEGYQVRIADGGEIALALARTEPPDLITLDLHLPDLDGYYVLECLHPVDGHRPVPIIVISGGIYRSSANDGVVGVLPKPFDLDELSQLVRTSVAAPPPADGHV